jgi:hypothetical protein
VLDDIMKSNENQFHLTTQHNMSEDVNLSNRIFLPMKLCDVMC